MGAIAQSIFGDRNERKKAEAWSEAMQSTRTDVPTWLSGGSQFAVEQAQRYAQRPYQAFQGQRVAGQSVNQQQASQLARRYGSQVGRNMGNAPTSQQLGAFENPYLESVLGARKRAIGDEYGRQAAAITQNQAATDAFRSGRSDLARSRLAFNRMQAIDDATNETKAGAFDRAMQNYFQNQQQQQGAFESASTALSGTGAIDRAQQQQGLDQEYQSYLDRRDWSVNNLGPLIQSIAAARGGTVTNSTGSQQSGQGNKEMWGALAGLIGQGIMTFAGSGNSTQPTAGNNFNYQNTTPASAPVANSGFSGPRE